MFRTNNLTKILALLAIGIALIGLSSAIICIYVSKPIGDDFGAIVFYRPDVWAIHTWTSLLDTGRYGQSVMGAIVYGLLGDKVSSILPFVILAWFITLVYLYTNRLLDRYFQLNHSSRYLSAIFTTLFTFLVLFVNNSVQSINPPTWMTYQTFFWPSGIITYTIPTLLILSAVYLLFVRRNLLSAKKRYIYFAVMVFVAGLFNETLPTTLFALAVALLLLSFVPLLKSALSQRPIYLITIAASFSALVMLFLSTGSQKRQVATGAFHRGDIVQTVLHNFWLTLNDLMFRPKELFLIGVCGLVIALVINSRFKNNHAALKKVRIHGLVFGSITIAFALGTLLCSLILLAIGYGEHSGVYARTLLIPQILYVLGLILLAMSMSSLIIDKFKPFVVNVMLLVTLLLFVILLPHYLNKIVSQVNSSIGYSNAWTEQEIIIKNKLKQDPNQTIYLPQSSAGIGDGFSLSCTGPYSSGTIWLNYQIAEYYNIKRVCSVQDPH